LADYAIATGVRFCLFVALEQERSVEEYAKRAGIAQPVMTRILFALGSTGCRRKPDYGLMQETIDTEDARRHQTFLTAEPLVISIP
jgi:hypothetical protein